MKPNADVFFLRSDGTRTGPHSGTLTPTFFTTDDATLDAVEGCHILRTLPSGRDEAYLITDATYYERTHSAASHWQLRLKRTTVISDSSKHNGPVYNFNNSQGIQVGDHNLMQFHASVEKIIEQIELSNGSEAEKAEAKSLLKSFLAHPLVVSVSGAAVAAAFAQLK